MDKVHYIYLNVYKNGYLYVGSHSWYGEENAVDPAYYGSSTIALLYKWKPIRIFILENVSSDRKFIAEREWIHKYASLYGIAPIVRYYSHSEWYSQFPQGLLLNCHGGCDYHSLKLARELSHSKESEYKRQNTRRLLGITDKCATKLRYYMTRDRRFLIAQSRDYSTSISKTIKVQKERGFLRYTKYVKVYSEDELITYGSVSSVCKELNIPYASCWINQQLSANNSVKHCNFRFELDIKEVSKPPVMSKVTAISRDYSSSISKTITTKRNKGVKPVYRKIIVVELGYTGYCRTVCRRLNHVGWATYLSRQFTKGIQEVKHHGFTFRVLE